MYCITFTFTPHVPTVRLFTAEETDMSSNWKKPRKKLLTQADLRRKGKSVKRPGKIRKAVSSADTALFNTAVRAVDEIGSFGKPLGELFFGRGW